MRCAAAAVTCLILLTACFSEEDAVLLLRDKERPYPIECALVYDSYTCTDGDGWTWVCDKNGCVNAWRPSK